MLLVPKAVKVLSTMAVNGVTHATIVPLMEGYMGVDKALQERMAEIPDAVKIVKEAMANSTTEAEFVEYIQEHAPDIMDLFPKEEAEQPSPVINANPDVYCTIDELLKDEFVQAVQMKYGSMLRNCPKVNGLRSFQYKKANGTRIGVCVPNGFTNRLQNNKILLY